MKALRRFTAPPFARFIVIGVADWCTWRVLWSSDPAPSVCSKRVQRLRRTPILKRDLPCVRSEPRSCSSGTPVKTDNLRKWTLTCNHGPLLRYTVIDQVPSDAIASLYLAPASSASLHPAHACDRTVFEMW